MGDSLALDEDVAAVGGLPVESSIMTSRKRILESGFVVKKLNSSIEDGFTPTAEDPVQVEKVGGTKIAISSPACRSVQQLLCPLEHAPIIICIGVNYGPHAAELKVRTQREQKRRQTEGTGLSKVPK